jgi:transcriptional regulator with XRE-family HTH domain
VATDIAVNQYSSHSSAVNQFLAKVHVLDRLLTLAGSTGTIRLMTARALLAWILGEARYTLDRSPEQVASSVGLSARTVRRLEDPDEARRPRAATLRPLATFYGLDPRFIEQLNEWGDLEGADLGAAVREQTAEMLEETDAEEVAGAPDELRMLALRAARRGGPGRATNTRIDELFGPEAVQPLERLARSLGADEQHDFIQLLDGFSALDRRRRRLLVALLQDLETARKFQLGL